MTAALRRTPTTTNGGSDNGVNYTNAVDAEIEALWKCVATELVSVGGTASAITASSDTALVAVITAYARPMAFWLTPVSDYPGGPGTIDIDGVGTVSLKDQDGNDPVAGVLKASRRSLISFDGTVMRVLGSASSSGGSTQDNSINGGRLTISSGVPVLSAAVTAATQALWSPDKSNLVSLYDGSSSWNIIPSAEVTIKFTDTQTGNTHSGTKVIDGLTDTSHFMVGMKISGTGVGSGSTIATIDSNTQITGTVNSTASASVSVTFKVQADTAVDIFGKEVSSALVLRGLPRATFATPNAMAKQDGIDVLSADHTLRWLGTISTSATDGQIDWVLNGLRRYRVWNRDNKKTLQNVESFASTATWRWTFGITALISEIFGGGGAGGSNASGSGFSGALPSGAPGGYSLKRFVGSAMTNDQTVTIGSTSSFGANHSATSGGAGASVPIGGASNANGATPGSGSSGDINVTGGGMPGGSGALAVSGAAAAGAAGGAPLIKVAETIEY